MSKPKKSNSTKTTAPTTAAMRRQQSSTTKTVKGHPYPVRLDQGEDEQMLSLKKVTGLPGSEILRRACRFSFPKFLSGEVDISRVA